MSSDEKSYTGGRELEAMVLAPNYHQWILSRFKPYLGKRVAEVGAGSGFVSSFLLKEPIDELVMIEPSDNMFELLNNRVGHDSRAILKHGTLDDVATDYKQYFDSVVYTNVLEHIKDDASEIAIGSEILKEGGYLCLFVPALSWLYSEQDRSAGHYRRYSKQPLRKMLECGGFEIIFIDYFDIAGILPWYVYLTLLHKQLSNGSTAFYDSVVIPIMRRIESFITPPIGKNLIAVAKKKSRV